MSFKSPDMKKCTKLKQFLTTGQSSHSAVYIDKIGALSQGGKGFERDTLSGQKLACDT